MAESAFPNATHAFQLFRLTELAENLTFLFIFGSIALNFDVLNTNGLDKLHALDLTSITISSENLQSILEQCEDAIGRFQLVGVMLGYPTGASRLSSLMYCHLDSSGY